MEKKFPITLTMDEVREIFLIPILKLLSENASKKVDNSSL